MSYYRQYERRMPEGVEDTLGTYLLWPDSPDEDTLVLEFAEVTDFAEGEVDEEYEFGTCGAVIRSGGGIEYEVTNLLTRDKTWVREDLLSQYDVPEGAKDLLDNCVKAAKLQQQARNELRRYEHNAKALANRLVSQRTERETQTGKPEDLQVTLQLLQSV